MSVALLPEAVPNHEFVIEALLSRAHCIPCTFPTRCQIAVSMWNMTILVPKVSDIPQSFLSPMTSKCHYYAESTDWMMRNDVSEVPFQAPGFVCQLVVTSCKDRLFASSSIGPQQQSILMS
jgi:hypothetical protein